MSLISYHDFLWQFHVFPLKVVTIFPTSKTHLEKHTYTSRVIKLLTNFSKRVIFEGIICSTEKQIFIKQLITTMKHTQKQPCPSCISVGCCPQTPTLCSITTAIIQASNPDESQFCLIVTDTVDGSSQVFTSLLDAWSQLISTFSCASERQISCLLVVDIYPWIYWVLKAQKFGS